MAHLHPIHLQTLDLPCADRLNPIVRFTDNFQSCLKALHRLRIREQWHRSARQQRRLAVRWRRAREVSLSLLQLQVKHLNSRLWNFLRCDVGVVLPDAACVHPVPILRFLEAGLICGMLSRTGQGSRMGHFLHRVALFVTSALLAWAGVQAGLGVGGLQQRVDCGLHVDWIVTPGASM